MNDNNIVEISQFNAYLLVLIGWTWPGAPSLAEAIQARNTIYPQLGY